MEFNDFIDQIEFAINQKQEELLFSRWIMHYESSMSFKEFKEKLDEDRQHVKQKLHKSRKSKDEILEEVNKIIAMSGGGLNGNL